MDPLGFAAVLWCTACMIILTTANKCADDITQKCMKSLLTVTAAKKPILARHKEELDQICSLLTPDLQCVNDYIHSCFSAEQKKALGDVIDKSTELIRDLCEEGPYKTEFLKHAECYQRIYSDDINACNDSYSQVINESNLPLEQRDQQEVQLKRYCCAYTDYLQCSIRRTREVCGPETALFMESHLRRAGDPLVMGQCNMNSYTMSECSSCPPALIISYILMIITMTAYLVLKTNQITP